MPRTGICLYARETVKGGTPCEGPVDFYPCGERCAAHSPKKEQEKK